MSTEPSDAETFKGIKQEHRAAYARTHNALHYLWSKCVGTPGYVKEEWSELDSAFSAFALDTASNKAPREAWANTCARCKEPHGQGVFSSAYCLCATCPECKP